MDIYEKRSFPHGKRLEYQRFPAPQITSSISSFVDLHLGNAFVISILPNIRRLLSLFQSSFL